MLSSRRLENLHDPKSQVFRNAIRQKQILFGPKNMSYYEVRTKYGIKKIITLGEMHTPGVELEHAYDIKKFVKDVFQKGLERRKCVDFFLENYFTPSKDTFGNKAPYSPSKYMIESSTEDSKLDTLNYTRNVFRDCLTSEGDCIIDGERYPNVRNHNWDLRFMSPFFCHQIFFQTQNYTSEDMMHLEIHGMGLDTAFADYYGHHYKYNKPPKSVLRSEFYPDPKNYYKDLTFWLLDLLVLDLKESNKFLVETKRWLLIKNRKNDARTKCQMEVLFLVRHLIRKQLKGYIGSNDPSFDMKNFKLRLAKSIYYTVMRNFEKANKTKIESMMMIDDDYDPEEEKGRLEFTAFLTDIYLFLRMFRKFENPIKRFACENQEHANHIILYAGDEHTHNINHLIEEFYGKESLVYQTEIVTENKKYVTITPSYNKYDRITIKNVDGLIRRFLS